MTFKRVILRKNNYLKNRNKIDLEENYRQLGIPSV